MGAFRHLRTMLSQAIVAAILTPPVAASSMAINFPAGKENIQLDLVGLLTVIGEAAMAIHAQAVTASYLCLLPRILPAPQAFLLPERQPRLPRNMGVTNVSILAGNIARDLNFLPDALLNPDSLEPCTIREVRIARQKYWKGGRIKPKRTGPTDILSMLGTVVGIGLLAYAIIYQDGMAIFAILLLGLTSTLTGLGSLWKLKLQTRTQTRKVPDGDVLIRTTTGSFIIVRCDESIARELFFGQERCEYVLSENWFRILAGAGTFTLMAAVVFLANCTWNLQATIGLAYIVLNALYWWAAVLSPSYSWDLHGKYDVQYVADDVRKDSYLLVLAEVVRRTKSINWAKQSNIVPVTRAWKRWLIEAETDANQTESTWKPGERLTKLIEQDLA